MKTVLNHVCNYAIIRFLPYPGTGEFVNLGVVAHCLETDFFGIHLERERLQRVTDFFPRLDKSTFLTALQKTWVDLERVRNLLPTLESEELKRSVFRELVRPRSSIFRFSEIKTAMTDDPQVLLEKLASQYVTRHC